MMHGHYLYNGLEKIARGPGLKTVCGKSPDAISELELYSTRS